MLVVTGPWSAAAADVLRRGEADGLVLNYARGFCEPDLELLDDSWGLRRLDVLDRTIEDLTPINRLGDSLKELSVQAAPAAVLDLAGLDQLASIAGEWHVLRETLGSVDDLQRVVTWRFDEVDLHAFRDHVGLQRLTIKDAPYLESLSGVTDLAQLSELAVLLARSLRDVGDISELRSLGELELQRCDALTRLDDVDALVGLRFLGFSDCGEIDTLAPVAGLQQLEVFYAWGSTRVLDNDLSPLSHLPNLREIRMRDRRNYRPRVAELVDRNRLRLRTGPDARSAS
jgi:internalin A